MTYRRPAVLLISSSLLHTCLWAQGTPDTSAHRPPTVLPQYNTGVNVTFFFLVVFFLLLLIVFIVVLSRSQRTRLQMQLMKEKAEQERNRAELQQKISDTALGALRSQMNPHFIFNCLNSIKLYATQNDAAAAAEYLSKFSRLMRLVLENSQQQLIPLHLELEALELYIQLEAMRFKEKLLYKIDFDKNVDLFTFEIPPLLIQPYVENAIWHGLMAKEEGGAIYIRLSYTEADNMLTITIKDNGIGRARAAELKSQSALAVKSFGTRITADRIHLINEIYNSGASAEIVDLYDKNQAAAGTLVTIRIPVN